MPTPPVAGARPGRALGRALLLLFGYMLSLPAASTLVGIGYFLYGQHIAHEELDEIPLHMEDVLAWLNAAAMCLILLVAIACAALALRWLDRCGTFRDLGFTWSRGATPAVFAVTLGGMVLSAVVFLIMHGLGLVRVTGWMWQREGWGDVGLDFLSSLLFLGSLVVAEELIFRGYIRFTLSRELPPRGVWVASAGLFALYRAVIASFGRLGAMETFLAVLVGFVVGLLLGALYMAGRTLWLPIGARLAWSLVGAFCFSLGVAGTPMEGIVETQVAGGLVTGGRFGPEGGLIGLLVLAVAGAALWFWERRKF